MKGDRKLQTFSANFSFLTSSSKDKGFSSVESGTCLSPIFYSVHIIFLALKVKRRKKANTKTTKPAAISAVKEISGS
jgi:hypothetical protein